MGTILMRSEHRSKKKNWDKDTRDTDYLCVMAEGEEEREDDEGERL